MEESPAGEACPQHLIRSAKRGSRTAFGRLCHLYRPRLRSYFTKRRLGADTIEDAMQETLTRTLTGLLECRIKTERFEGWLFSTASHVGAELLRQQRRALTNQSLESAPAAEADSSRMERHEQCELVRRAIEELPQPYREVIWMRHIEGLSYRRIAYRQGVTVGLVGVRLYRARRILQRVLADKV